MAAKRAPVRQENPVDGLLDGIPEAHAPEVDRSAIGTAGEEHRFTVASFLELSKDVSRSAASSPAAGEQSSSRPPPSVCFTGGSDLF